jgi:hypothetical protein
MASEHILLTKEQFERLKKNKIEEVIVKNTSGTQTDIPQQAPTSLPTTQEPNRMPENEAKLQEADKHAGSKAQPSNKLSRKTIGQRRARISKKLVKSKISMKENQNKNSTNKVIAWHRL